MPAQKPDLTLPLLPLDTARRIFVAAQLPPRPAGSAAQALEETGFVRTLGGVDVYIAVRARVPGMRRADLDAAVERREVLVTPAVRGCIYLVPRRDAPLALRVADLLSRSRSEREHEKAGIRPGEVEEVGRAVLEVLRERGPLTTDALRRAMPPGAVRSLGEAGKKLGLSSPLPPALRHLEFAGQVERTLEEGRLDSERYRWRIAERSPFESAKLPQEPVELFAGMARIFFRGAGLGTVRDFAGWAGLSQRDARAAVERCPLVPIAIEGVDEVHYLLEERRDLLEAADSDTVALLPFEDNLVALHGGPALLVDRAHHGTPVPSWGSSKISTLGEARHMSLRGVVAEGKIAGFWEYDPDAREVVIGTFNEIPAATRKRLDAEAEALAHFLADDIGHGRSFNLDTDDDMRQRAAVIRRVG